MASVLTRFITAAGVTVWFPQYDPVDPQDTGGYQSHTLPLSSGGIYDADADDRPARGIRKLTRRGVLREDSKRELQDAYEALAVAAGTRGRLYRQTETGDRADWIMARLMLEVEDRTPQITRQDDGHWVLATTITLELQDRVWHGVRHGSALTPLDTGYSLDVGIPFDDVADSTTLTTSPQTVTVANNGNMPVDDIDIALTVAGTSVTVFTLQSGRAKWTVTGTIPVGNTLRVNTANASVANETALTAPVAAGSASLPVTNAAGLGWAAGGRVRLTLTDGTLYEGTIDHLTGTTTVVLTAALPVGAASGAIVGAASYSGFARDSVLHTIDTWLRLASGSNSVVITRTGGANSQIVFTFFDAWS